MDEAKSLAGNTADWPSDGDDPRSAPRFALLMRTAKLVCASGEFLCIVRDLSATGLRLKVFHSLPRGEAITLELSNGNLYPVDLIWERDDHVGLRFREQADVQTFVNETSRWPKRPIRLRLGVPATITAGGVSMPAELRNLSLKGAGIRVEKFLAKAQKVRIEAPGLPELIGTVCWRANPEYGLVLQQCFAFDELARLAPGLGRGAVADRNIPETSHRIARTG